MKTCIKLINEVISDYREALDSVGPRLCYWYTEKELCAMTRAADARGAVSGDVGHTRVVVANSYTNVHPGDCLCTHLERRDDGWYIVEVTRVAKTKTSHGRGSTFVAPRRALNNRGA